MGHSFCNLVLTWGHINMADVFTGGCLCGNIRFSCGGAPAPAAYCHCEDCRRCTGSAFNVSLPVEAAHFEIISGQTKAFTKTADSGHQLTRHFCADCGSPIYTSSPRHPDRIYVKAGTLDNPALVKPAFQSWTQSAVSWALIEPDLPDHEKKKA